MPSQQLKDVDHFIRILRQHLPEIREKYSVSYLGVFGSYVRGEQTGESDLDVILDFLCLREVYTYYIIYLVQAKGSHWEVLEK
ncbi:MAG: nucleotidyltransferase domain-containing protein [Methanosarcina flavescens]|jgi:predicted nucleotidyltransferase|uniref:DNA polymerase III subunit beta n=1 Tax=Methanosarcina flavescens TaxID=1715806 RepID=A0A660HPD5_9EURY|nr:nucleotidyltransferase domain-containing protein [Methanosarcina flavescens]AYK14147.1 DNA polymerase III subunit beta [Methanosarcina flavescens]NLK32365.1 DNA polymerase III subunit beta [Methanosarcina flavescens]